VDVDLGMLVVRLALGPMLLMHGWNKAGGAGGIGGTARWFEGLGLRPGRPHARLAAATELGAGVLVSLGLRTSGAAWAGLAPLLGLGGAAVLLASCYRPNAPEGASPS
jgi:putative oxidoreductase